MIGIAFAPLLGGVLLDAIGDHHVAMWLAIATIGGAQTLCFVAFVRRRSGGPAQLAHDHRRPEWTPRSDPEPAAACLHPLRVRVAPPHDRDPASSTS